MTCSFSAFFYNLRAPLTQYRSTGAWGVACDSICLTGWVTHDPSTGVRATTSLGGERAQQAAYSLPSPWAAARRERLRLCTQSACRFSLIAYRTSLQYGKYSCVSSARSEEKSADAFCAQSLCAATLLFSRALFSTTLPSLGENERAEPFSRFHEINFFPLRSVQHHGNV